MNRFTPSPLFSSTFPNSPGVIPAQAGTHVDVLSCRHSRESGNPVTSVRYPKYRDSGAAWLGEVPAHWEAARLRWLSQRYAGGTPSKDREEFWLDGKIPWLNSGAVNDALITEPSAYITQEAFERSSAKWIPKDALVMALAGQGKTKGTVAQVGFRTTCNQSMAAIVPTDRIEPRFLFWWLQSNYQNIRNMSGGDLRDGLNLELLGDIPCPLCDRNEQSAIAAFLDRETVKIDALIAEQEKLIALLKEKRQALISHAVTKGLDPNAPMKHSGIEWLGQMPAHWELKRLKHVKAKAPNAFVDGPFGSNLKSVHFVDGGDVYVIESNFATQRKLDVDDLKTITSAHFATIQRSQVRGGDIVIAKIGAQFGKSAILPDLGLPAVVSGNSMKLTVDVNECTTDWVLLQLENLKTSSPEIELMANGSAQPALSLGSMNELPILVPPLTEQRDVVGAVAQACARLEQLDAGAFNAVVLLKERRAALISAAVTGKICVLES
jgi:type I restriction enzyme S subunit